jgi:transposase
MAETIVVTARKRTWPEDVKRRLLSEAQEPGETICSVARRYDVEPAQLYHWRKYFRDKEQERRAMSTQATTPDASPAFLPIEVSAPGSEHETGNLRPAPHRAEIAFPNGRRLSVSAGLDRRLLKELIGAVAAAS